MPLRDTQAGLKGFQAHLGRRLFEKVTTPGFAFDLELLVAARVNKIAVATVPVCYSYETAISAVSFFRQSLLMLADVLTIKLRAVVGRYHINDLYRF